MRSRQRAAPDDRPECPRCGYDLRGTVGTWRDRCPMEGLCQECGLTVRWCEVLRPDRFEPRWSVEYAKPFRLAPALWSTVRRSFVPWRFWASLRLTQHVRAGRLCLYVALLAVAVVGALVVEQAAVGGAVRFRIDRWAQVASVQHSYVDAILEAVLDPVGSQSRGRFTLTGGWVRPYPAPIRLHATLSQNGPGAPAVLHPVSVWVRPVAMIWLYTTALYLVMPIGFVLLPVSRRRARVRWRHVVRVTAYSLVHPALIAVVAIAALTVGVFLPTWLSTVLGSVALLIFILPVPMLAVWWTTAIERYLRIPHGVAVSILLVVMWALVILASLHLSDELY